MTDPQLGHCGWFLFAGKGYYPDGGAEGFVATFDGDLYAALSWAEAYDTDAGDHWWEYADWKQLAKLEDGTLRVVKRWSRDYDLVPVEPRGHRKRMGPWEVYESD